MQFLLYFCRLNLRYYALLRNNGTLNIVIEDKKRNIVSEIKRKIVLRIKGKSY